MTRHSKNNTANPIFTYHERKQVKDFNSIKQRLGSSSLRKFEQCWLCLSTAIKPVTTPLGYIYCHECIIVSLSKQMETNKKRLQQWESDFEEYNFKLSQLEEAQNDEKKRRMIHENLFGVAKRFKGGDDKVPHSKEDSSNISNSFWLNGGDKKDKLYSNQSLDKLPEKPKNVLKCPTSGKPLKIRELVKLNPEILRDSDEEVWICSISKKPISHHPSYAVRTTGQLVLKEFVGKSDEITSEDPDMLISLIPGGTGFSSHNNVQVTKFRPVMRQ